MAEGMEQKERLGRIVGTKEPIEETVVKKLIELGYSITTTESCTGGLLAGTIMNVSGVSAIYKEGFITYANEAKEELLGVSHKDLSEFGAVSDVVARQMAEGARKRANADCSLATTGIAGPDGGTAQKPVGLVYIGCCVKERTIVEKCQFKGSRLEVRLQAVERALQILLENLA